MGEECDKTRSENVEISAVVVISSRVEEVKPDLWKVAKRV